MAIRLLGILNIDSNAYFLTIRTIVLVHHSKSRASSVLFEEQTVVQRKKTYHVIAIAIVCFLWRSSWRGRSEFKF